MSFAHLKKHLSGFVALIIISVLSCAFAFASSKFEDKTTAQCLEDNPIDSSRNYRIQIPEDFLARNFWAVFAYDSRTCTFIANGMKGRHLSSRDDLMKNDDGSTDIYIGPTAPKGLESNWIETISGSKIFIGLRTYGPEESVLKGIYKMPRFTLLK